MRGTGSGLLLLLLLFAALASGCSDEDDGVLTDSSDSVAERPAPGELRDIEPGVARLEGEGAIEAALAMSSQAFERAPAVLLGRDDLYADALAAAGAQRQLRAPLLLLGGGVLSDTVRQELWRLDTRTVYVLGGPEAVSDVLVTSLRRAGMTVQRLGGANRFATAVALAERFYPDVDGAVLVPGSGDGAAPDAAVDTLGAGAAAATANHPLLLTHADRLPEETRAFLARGAVAEVVVVGGPQAVDDDVVEEIEELGITVTRVAGTSRFDTAARLAELVGSSTPPAYTLVDGSDPGAWASGFPAAALGAPVLLTDGDQLPEPTARAITGALVRGGTLVCAVNVTDTACARAEALAGS